MIDSTAAGWIVVIAVTIAIYLFWITTHYYRELKTRKRLSGLLAKATPVCGFIWCTEPEESSVHTSSSGDVQEGQHAYVAALLVQYDVSIISPAIGERREFKDWRIKS